MPLKRPSRSARKLAELGGFETSRQAPGPLAPVVSVGGEAWTLDLVKSRRRLEVGDLVITWEPGQSSPLDAGQIDAGQDIGNVVVQRRTARGLEDAVYDVSFAFAFHAFHPQAPIHVK